MSCCSEYIDFGCIDACVETTLTGYNADATGSHTLHAYISNGTWLAKTVSYTSGNPLTIPAQTLPETGMMDIRIKKPDGTYYAFSADTDCLRVTTQIYQDIVT